MTGPQPIAPVELGSREWFRRTGEASLTLGTGRFQEALIDLYGCLVDHSARWIIRFSDIALPEVMYTRNVPASLVDHYSRSCSNVDPFAAHWRLYKEAGVYALSQFKEAPGPVDPRIYSRVFASVANVSDELGLFLSTVGQSSAGFFLERETGEFSADEIERVKAAFPIFDGLYRAHIGRIFDRMRYNGGAAEEFDTRPLLVQDRHGIEIYATPAWQAAASQDPEIQTAIRGVRFDKPLVLRNFIVNFERLDKYFPLAPHGVVLTLVRQSQNPDERAAARARIELIGSLTAREKDVFNLILAGGSTSAISKTLCLTKETVKNYKLKIYKKAKTSSERVLIQRYAFRETLNGLN